MGYAAQQRLLRQAEQKLFFFTTSPYSMLAIGPVIIAFAVRLSDSTLLSKHDGFIGCASKEAQSGSIVTLVAVTGPPRKQNKKRY